MSRCCFATYFEKLKILSALGLGLPNTAFTRSQSIFCARTGHFEILEPYRTEQGLNWHALSHVMALRDNLDFELTPIIAFNIKYKLTKGDNIATLKRAIEEAEAFKSRL